MRQKLKRSFYFKVIISCFLLIIIIFPVNKLLDAFTSSKYFLIKEIISPNNQIRCDYLKGKNIFSLNLKLIFERLSLEYPDWKINRLTIQPPDRLIIDAQKRKAVAYLRLYHDFAIDEEGSVFKTEEFDNSLPIIFGLENKIRSIKVGEKINQKEILLALRLIKEFNEKQDFKNYKIRKINIASIWDISFFIDGIEVKIDKRISEGLNLLVIILRQLNQKKVSYIDLRFKEPVVKYE